MKLIACSVLLLVVLGESYCKPTSTRNRTSTSWGYDYTIGEDRGYNVKKDDNGYHVEPFHNVSSSGLKPHYSSNTVYEHSESPGPNDSQSQSSANVVNNDTPSGPTYSRSHGTVEWSQRDKDTQTETPVLTVPSDQSRASGKPATDIKDLYLYDSLSRPLPEHPMYSSYGPLYGPSGPMYRPQGAPMYGPPTHRTYRPHSDQMYRQQTDLMYRPQSDPMYRPQPDPNYRTLEAPNYASPNNPVYEPQNGQMYRRQNTYSYPTSSLRRIEPYRDY